MDSFGGWRNGTASLTEAVLRISEEDRVAHGKVVRSRPSVLARSLLAAAMSLCIAIAVAVGGDDSGDKHERSLGDGASTWWIRQGQHGGSYLSVEEQWTEGLQVAQVGSPERAPSSGLGQRLDVPAETAPEGAQKQPCMGCLYSWLIPGAGLEYADQPGWATAYFLVSFPLMLWQVHEVAKDRRYGEPSFVPLMILAPVRLVEYIHTYTATRRYNQEHGYSEN